MKVTDEFWRGNHGEKTFDDEASLKTQTGSSLPRSKSNYAEFWVMSVISKECIVEMQEKTYIFPLFLIFSCEGGKVQFESEA